MDNQHRKISGYRELNEDEVALMNEIKAVGPKLQLLLDKVAQANTASWLVAQETLDSKDLQDESDRRASAQPERWAAIARTHFQEGLMALTRAVAQPSTF